jgi:alcohol dehydrogenase YqhD (iron-dependent ADH family)
MQDFIYQSPTKIIFGKGARERVGCETAAFGKKALLHYGGGHLKKTGIYQKIADSLTAAGVTFAELPGAAPNPRLPLVHEGIRLCREEGVDFILAAGGGSVIDSAKAIAMGVPYGGDVWDFFEEKAEPACALPVGVVLTIAAAGSEASKGCVITNEATAQKLPVNYDGLRPKFAVMNPELTYTLPPYQTACGVADIMAHVMERYFTREPHVDLSDRLCEGVLKTVIETAPAALKRPDDYDARAEIMWAGTVAHNDLLGMGRIEDWASHRIEHELSAINDVAHGAGLAVIFPAWMKYVYKQNLPRFVQYAVRVWNAEQDYEDPEKTALAGIARTKAYFASLGLPVSLDEIGIGEAHYGRIAQNCKRNPDGNVGFFLPLKPEDIVRILEIAQHA